MKKNLAEFVFLSWAAAFLAVVAMLLFSGCATRKPKANGGGTSHTVISPGQTNLTEFHAPDDPNGKSAQIREIHREKTRTIAPGATITTQALSVDGGKTNVVTTTTKSAEPIVEREVETEKTDTQLGTTHQPAEQLAAVAHAAYKAVMPLHILALLMILGGAAVAYFTTWKIKGVLISLGGLALFFLANFSASHQGLVAAVIVAGVAAWFVWSHLVWFKAQAESLIDRSSPAAAGPAAAVAINATNGERIPQPLV